MATGWKALDSKRIDELVKTLADELEAKTPLAFLSRTAVSTSSAIPSIKCTYIGTFMRDPMGEVVRDGFTGNSIEIDTTVIDWLEDKKLW